MPLLWEQHTSFHFTCIVISLLYIPTYLTYIQYIHIYTQAWCLGNGCKQSVTRNLTRKQLRQLSSIPMQGILTDQSYILYQFQMDESWSIRTPTEVRRMVDPNPPSPYCLASISQCWIFNMRSSPETCRQPSYLMLRPSSLPLHV